MVSGRKQAAAAIRSFWMITAPSCSGRPGWKMESSKIARDARIQPHAAFDERAQPDVALQHDQRADLPLGEMLGRQQDFAERFGGAEAFGQAEPALAPEARQGAPDLRLEEHDDGQADVGNDEGQQRAQRLQARPTATA